MLLLLTAKMEAVCCYFCIELLDDVENKSLMLMSVTLSKCPCKYKGLVLQNWSELAVRGFVVEK